MKACPNCETNENVVYRSIGGVTSVRCETCGLRGPMFESDEEAIRAWNALPRREDAQAEHARAERLADIVRFARSVFESGTMMRGGLLVTSRFYDNLMAEILCAAEDGDLGETGEP